MLGNHLTIGTQAGASFNLFGSNDTANLSTNGYIGLLAGDTGDTVTGSNATIGAQDGVTFNLSGSLNFSGSNDVAYLSDHSYIGLLSGDHGETVVGNNATIGTQDGVSFNLLGSNDMARTQIRRAIATSSIVVEEETSVSAAVINACVVIALHAPRNCMHAR